MPKKRVLLVDDNRLVRSLVRQLFELQPEFEISGEAETGVTRLRKLKISNPI
jgi:DNA-binding NarL/FixJ family response regulator